MKNVRFVLGAGTIMALTALPALSFAQSTGGSNQSTGEPAGYTTTTVGQGTTPGALPVPRSDNDPAPPVAAPAVVRGNAVVAQAGTGGSTAYGRAGVLELGGSVGFSAASGFTSLNISPQIGWFFMDNVQISAIVGFNHVSTSADSAAYITALVEPSFHIPLSQSLFAFAGLGAGLSYASDPGAGFALAPRVGANIMVGRSGILTPQFQFVYSTSDAVQTPNGTLLAVSTSYNLGAGYTVMW